MAAALQNRENGVTTCGPQSSQPIGPHSPLAPPPPVTALNRTRAPRPTRQAPSAPLKRGRLGLCVKGKKQQL
ncbi:hypothetical protein EYF80_006933 [Liparis tanakae]|uniref:Uncharacterized protein n=1 Tax=Liparis tanakae TaxID=230148 RepID=A0A4Z2IYM0_9TELE|nr:hypothetical protein EYF80_006933 [Liparis tanakae]